MMGPHINGKVNLFLLLFSVTEKCKKKK